MSKISVCIVAHDEEKIIRRCLDSIKNLADEIIFVHDGDCHDQTVSIAREYTDRIFIRPFIGIAEPHRSFTFAQASGDWIFQIDADEYLDAESLPAIKQLIQDDGIDGYWFRWELWDGTKPIHSEGIRKLCLARKAKMYYRGLPQEGINVVDKNAAKTDIYLRHRPNYNNVDWRIYWSKIKKWLPIHARYFFPELVEYQCFNTTIDSWLKEAEHARRHPLAHLAIYPLIVFYCQLRNGLWRSAIGWHVAIQQYVNYVYVYWNVWQLKRLLRKENKKSVLGGKQQSSWLWLSLFLFAALNLLVYWKIFSFHPNNDTDGFLYLIQAFRGQDAPVYPNRYLNPFYAIVGATVFSACSPAHALILTNIIFYFGLVFLTFFLIRRVFKSDWCGWTAAALLATAYPLLRYGLTQVQDIGGYFWFLATVCAAWLWREKKQWPYLLLAGSAVGFGILTKESGCMGALFFAGLVLVAPLNWKEKAKACLLFSVIPLAVLIFNAWNGSQIGYSSAEWFVWNWQVYAPGNFTFIKWLGVNLSTYNFVWLIFAAGLYFLLRQRRALSEDIKIYLMAMILPSLSYFAWPIFISRTVFISAWLVLPIAAYGLKQISQLGQRGRILAVSALIIALLSPYALQAALRYANVFAIFESCHYQPHCSFDFFVKNWHDFSVTGDRAITVYPSN